MRYTLFFCLATGTKCSINESNDREAVMAAARVLRAEHAGAMIKVYDRSRDKAIFSHNLNRTQPLNPVGCFG